MVLQDLNLLDFATTEKHWKIPSHSNSGTQFMLRKKKEKGEMGNQARHDRLSDLPLSIIDDILGRVPIREAIRMSVLSRQWRYTWTTLPHLIFNCDGFDWCSQDHKLMQEFEENTDDFISNVLLLHKGPIHSFEMSYLFFINIHSTEKWIICLSRNDVRELFIRTHSVDEGDVYFLNSSIYLCAKLTKLELWCCAMDPPPSTFKGFLHLTSLVLGRVELSSDAVETLVVYCPLLEKLTVKYSRNSEFRIRSPNLKNLHLSGKYTELCLHSPILDELFVHLTVSQFAPKNLRPVCNYTNFLSGVTDLIELGGEGYFAQYLSIGIESCVHTLVFHHLKVIKLTGVNFGDIKETVVVARLITGAPNLNKLVISAKSICIDGALEVSRKDFGFAPNFKLEKLRDVSLPSVCNYRLGMLLVKFLLENSPVLETMKLDFSDRPRFHNVSAELLEFRRASPFAKLCVSIIAYPTF